MITSLAGSATIECQLIYMYITRLRRPSSHLHIYTYIYFIHLQLFGICRNVRRYRQKANIATVYYSFYRAVTFGRTFAGASEWARRRFTRNWLSDHLFVSCKQELKVLYKRRIRVDVSEYMRVVTKECSFVGYNQRDVHNKMKCISHFVLSLRSCEHCLWENKREEKMFP